MTQKLLSEHKGMILFFANSDPEKEMGAVIHGAKGFDDLSGGEYDDIIYIDYGEDNGEDIVSGGMGDDVFVIHGETLHNESIVLLNEDGSKQDMNEARENLLDLDSVSMSDVTPRTV